MLYTLVLLAFASLVSGTLYVIQPTTGQTCHGGQPCTIAWLDDGTQPLLNSIGACTVGLYTGHQQLVQQIDPVDTTSSHSLQFTPDPQAGPDSDTYYIAFTSISLKFPDGSPYQAFSPSFVLDEMKGSFSSPVSSDTSAIPIPSSLTSTTPNTVASTIVIGTPPVPSSTAPPLTSNSTPSSISSTSTRFSTSVSPASISSSASVRPSTTPSSNAALSLSATRTHFTLAMAALFFLLS